jgi:GDP-L-fucose synthase
MSILILGGNGLVGSAVKRYLSKTNRPFIAASRQDADLQDFQQTNAFFQKVSPKVIICAAAKVGGMYANKIYPVEFLLDNLVLQNNVFKSAYLNQVKKLVFLGSSCIYPVNASQPISESALLTGPLEKTNEAYAIAKIAGVKLVQAYRDEYKTNWISVMPTNLYGPGDNYDLQNSHVLAAFVRKFYEAVANNLKSIELWGTGDPRREFMHIDDFACALVHVLDNYEDREPINIGTGKDISIRELAKIMTEISGYAGEISWNTTIPDGTYRKLLDTDKLTNLGWTPKIDFISGLKDTYNWYTQNHMKSRQNVSIKTEDFS